MRIAKISVGATIMLAAVVCNSQGAARLTTIYQSASGPDALVPTSVLSDGNGGFYGTMTSGAQMGAVFHLTPPAETGGVWTEAAINTFAGGDGRHDSQPRPDDGWARQPLRIGNGWDSDPGMFHRLRRGVPVDASIFGIRRWMDGEPALRLHGRCRWRRCLRRFGDRQERCAVRHGAWRWRALQRTGLWSRLSLDTARRRRRLELSGAV